MDFNSDDDFDGSNNSYGDNYNGDSGYTGSNPNGLSKAELRKTNKPIMEKRRRARINHCLNELKSLILEAMKKDPARHTKLEKADILEMTVKHLQSVQRQQLNMAIQTDPTVIHKFKSGFVECAEEVNRYICQLDGVEVGVRQRLTSHLSSCATSLEQIGSMTNFNNGYRGQLSASNVGLFGSILPNHLAAAAAAAAASSTSAPATVGLFPPLPQDLNNNSNQSTALQMGRVQLIPSRLPSGEIALIVPNTADDPASLLNNNNKSDETSLSWPASGQAAPAIAALPQNNEFTINLKSLSAFSKPARGTQLPYQLAKSPVRRVNVANNNLKNHIHHSSTTTASPPPSPISSDSSHGDDSLMHTSSDFAVSRPTTPPLDGVSSPSFSGVFATPPSAESSLTLSLSHLQQQQVSSTSGSDLNSTTSPPPPLKLKRSADSNDDSGEPSAKKVAVENAVEKGGDCEDERDMWRPW